MMVDYKVVEEREENGLIYQRVRFYAGDEVLVGVYDIDTDTTTQVLTYVRNEMIEENEYWYE